jgi:hypothetical protein
MDALEHTHSGKTFLDLLVGIEAGTLGGLAMLLWFALMSPLIGQPWWLIPNLFASHFYRDSQLLSGAGIPTWVGAAFHLLASGLVGALNGVLTPGGRLFGLGVAAIWYLVCYIFLWKRFAPGLLLHASQPLLIVAYILYGSAIGWHPQLKAQARA